MPRSQAVSDGRILPGDGGQPRIERGEAVEGVGRDRAVTQLRLGADLAERALADPDADLVDVGGVGGTLAGNSLSMAAARATLAEVLTDDAFGEMSVLAQRFTAGVQDVLDSHDLPWTVTRLGARAEYRFARPAPRTGTESAAAGDDDVEEYLHLAMANRGILLTPFHNMALMCPATTEADVDRHTAAFADVVAAIVAPAG